MAHSNDNQPIADRLVAWINTDGIDQGDELERMRYLEANAAALTVVQHLVPIVAAVAVLAGGRASAWPIFAVVMVPVIGFHFALWYLRGQGVRVATHWLRTSPSRRYSLTACYTVFIGSIIVVDALPITPQIFVIMVGSQVLAFWVTRNDALRRHDDEVAGTGEPVIPGRRRRMSALYLVGLVVNTLGLVLFVASGELLSPVTPMLLMVSFGCWWWYRQECRRDQAVR